VITLDSSDEESVEVKREVQSDVETAQPSQNNMERSDSLKAMSKRKRKPKEEKINNKKLKQMFGSDDSENEMTRMTGQVSKSGPPTSSTSTESPPPPDFLSEPFSPISSEDEAFQSPVKTTVQRSPKPVDLSKAKMTKAKVSSPVASPIKTPIKSKPIPKLALSTSKASPMESPTKNSEKSKPFLTPKVVSLSPQVSNLDSPPCNLLPSPDTELVKLAEKIKAARQEREAVPTVSIPTETFIKLELPVLHIKKEVMDSDLPPIVVTGGYSQEPQVITIYDSEDEEDYDAKHSQAGNSFGDVEDMISDNIKEEILSDSEEFRSGEFEDAEDDEEIQILQSSENKLFAAISKRIKVEFDETLEREAQELVGEVIAEEGKEKEMIKRLTEAVGCDVDMAICAIAQAKEIYGCNEPTFEQTVQVITGEDDDSSSDGDDEVTDNHAEDIQMDTDEPDHPKVVVESPKKPPSECSNTSRESIDDLLDGLDDDDELPDIPPVKKQTSGMKKGEKSTELSSSKKRLSNELCRNLFDDDLDLDETKNIKPSTSSKSLGSKPRSSSPISSTRPPASPPVSVKSYGGARLIEPMAMPKRRGQNPRPTVSSSDLERRSILETLHKSRPKPKSKPLFKLRDQTEHEQLAAERKQKLANIAFKNKKVVSVKETTAPVGIMKMSQPKSQSLLQEMSSCSSMQPKRKQNKPKLEIIRPKVTKNKYYNEQPPPPSMEKPVDFETEPEKRDQVILDEEKRKKYAETSDGYIVPKKMSVSNIEYSRKELQTEPTVVVKHAGVEGSILRKKGKVSVIKKRVAWRDQNGFQCLVEMKMIPNENIGKKCNSENNKDSHVKVQQTSECVGPKAIKKDVLMDDIFGSILNWNTAWLEEQKKMSDPPPVHQPWQLIPVTNTFSNWEEYRKIFLPLMLLEMWSSISREYEEKKSTREDIVPVCLQEVSQDPKGQFLVVRCMGLLTEQEMRRDLGIEGILVQLNVSFNLGNATAGGKQAREIKPCFGFVQNIKRVPFRKDYGSFGEFDLERIKRLESLAIKNKQRKGVLSNLVNYTLRVKLNLVPPGRKLSSEKPIYMKALSRIRPDMRKFEAILDLPQSRLFESIVSPKKETLQVPQAGHNLHATIQSIPQMAHLNQCQKEIIVSVSQACVLQPEVPKTCLVQGPPGTGKSSTIAGLILQILYSKMENGKVGTMPRILVVAPSNAAVDELALKLINLKPKLPEAIRFKMLRLGVQHSMHHQVRSYSYDAQIGQYIAAETRQAKATESLEKDERNKQSAANQIYAEKMKAEAEGKTDLAGKLTRDYKEKFQQIEKIKAEIRKPLDMKTRKELERVAAERTLAGADIILATLSSSLSAQMEKYFIQGVGTSKGVGSLRPISVCIMDEASQCVEPEALIPFKLGFCKLVMVGDHEQLPATVTCRKAQQLDYQQSLFGRLFSYFTGLGGEEGGMVNPVLRLHTQYRMHKEIASWPARYFYGGKLQYGGQDRTSCLPPYTVLHVAGEARQQGGHCWNTQEEKVVIATIQAIKAMVGDKLSIGVITFYAKQKQNLNLEILNRRMANIVVNTVDGFQGSERDVIIISCVRGGGGGIGFLQDRQRLNVALTRAKYSLVVVGNMGTLRSASEMWAELVSNAESRNMSYKLEVEKDRINQEQLRSIMGRARTGQS